MFKNVRNLMTKEQKQQWIEALKSGDYEQGKGRLIHGNQYGKRYCCLGVAKELFNIPKKSNDQLLDGFLPDLTQADLAQMNDRGDSFKQIANYIQKNI